MKHFFISVRQAMEAPVGVKYSMVGVKAKACGRRADLFRVLRRVALKWSWRAKLRDAFSGDAKCSPTEARRRLLAGANSGDGRALVQTGLNNEVGWALPK